MKRHESHRVPIAPAPAQALNGHSNTDQLTSMRFNCQECVRKKVKCNRSVPKCASCSKAKLECVYQAPPPRRKRKRSQGEDVYERLARYERILSEHNLLPAATASTPGEGGAEASVNSTRLSTPVLQDSATAGSSRYIDNALLLDAGEGDLCEVSESEQEDYWRDKIAPGEDNPAGLLGALTAHTISASVLGSTRNLSNLYPSYEQATKLWHTYVQNVDPLCKVLHIPTVAKMVDTVAKHPSAASKKDECLLFAIYHFAVFSMSDPDCLRDFNDSRAHLMARYRATVTQALVNASWLKTTAMPILQAYTLFLVALRTQIDSHTFWILTGIAIRLAQSMGLHRDGENIGLPPFEVQMRRRLFWQLLPLDGYAGQTSGTGIFISPDSWDTKQPLNINDDQIFPGMTEPPRAQQGPSEMFFCLSRMALSDFYIRKGVKLKESGAAIQFWDAEDTERLIDEVEDLIERKFLRYCDILNPLHFLTTGIMRSAINSVRLRARMPLLMKPTITDSQRRELCVLAEKVLDANNAMFSNSSTQKFRWHIRAFFLWDSLLCILRCITAVGFYPPGELDAAWGKVTDVYNNHDELTKSRRTLHVTIAKLTLKAWLLNPPCYSSVKPAFITALRAQHEPKEDNRPQDSMFSTDKASDEAFGFDELLNNMDGTELSINNALDFDSISDWATWEQMCRETGLG